MNAINNSQNLMSTYYVGGHVLTSYIYYLILLNNCMRPVPYYLYLTSVETEAEGAAFSRSAQWWRALLLKPKETDPELIFLASLFTALQKCNKH